MLAQSFFWKLPETETVILRPVHILGRVRNAAVELPAPRARPHALGFDPMVQVIHQSDVVRAIELALGPAIRGIFNLAGPEPVAALAHHQDPRTPAHLASPIRMAKVVLRRLWSLRLTDLPRPGARSHPLRLHGGRRRALGQLRPGTSPVTTRRTPSAPWRIEGAIREQRRLR